MKPRYTSNRVDGLFVGYEQTEKFIFSKFPPTCSRSKKRKIVAMVSTLCSEFSDKMGTFIEGIGKLDRKDAGSSRNNLHRTKRRRSVGNQDTKNIESEHDGGIPEDDAEYLPSSDSGKDEASSSDDSSDAFVAPRTANPKQNILRQKTLASRTRGNVAMKQRATEAETARECAKAGNNPEVSHNTTTGKLNQEAGNTSANANEMQGRTTFNIYGAEHYGHKATTSGDNTPSCGNIIPVLNVSPISSAPPLEHFVPQKTAQHTQGPAISVPYRVGSNHQQSTSWPTKRPTPPSTDKLL